eukprot:10109615-Ditylum_brightwellii.AAC.1
MDAIYTLVQDLLMGNALAAFNNKQATFKEQTLDNLEHCLNAVAVQVFPNKAYKLQKWYIWCMMYKPRYISIRKWISRVIKLNNYLTEFYTPTWRHSNGRGCHYCKYHGHCNHSTDECRLTMNQHKGRTCHEREDRPHNSKKVCFSSGKAKSHEALPDRNKDLHTIINEKIATALSCQEKKDLNKFEALSISSGSDNGNNNNSNSRVSNTSNEEMNSE